MVPTVNAPVVASPVAPSIAVVNDMPAWVGIRDDEPFDVSAYLTSREDFPDNAAPLYLQAFGPTCSEFGGGKTTPLGQQINALAKMDRTTLDADTARQIDDALAHVHSAIREIDAAQTKPRCVFITPLTVDADLGHVLAARKVSRISMVQLQQARRTRDFDKTMAALRRSLRMSRDIQPRANSVCQIVSIAIQGLTLAGIERITLTQPELTTAQIDEILTLLNSHQQQSLDQVDEGLKADYVISRNALDQLRGGVLTYKEVMELQVSGVDVSATELPTPPIANYDAEYAALNQLFKQAIEAAQHPNDSEMYTSQYQQASLQTKTSLAEFKQLIAATALNDRPKLLDRAPAYLYLSITPAAVAFIEANRRAATQLAGVQLLLALRRYEISHGRLPETLEQAAAECTLKTVPLDPYDGQPMRYAVVAGKPTVYSVGQDRKDDGGQIDSEFGERPGDHLFILRARNP